MTCRTTGVYLKHASISWRDKPGAADLSEANLRDANLLGASLVHANLTHAQLTGVKLYGIARDDWKIDSVHCDYIFGGIEGKKRIPKDRNFEPGEFEELYKQLPTFDYFFKHGFTALDAVVMSRIVEAINEKHPEFELRLDSFHSRGQPHAKFTVLHQEVVEEAKQQVTTGYESNFAEIRDKQEEMMKILKMVASKQYSITAGGDVIITDIQGNIHSQQVAIGKDIDQHNNSIQNVDK